MLRPPPPAVRRVKTIVIHSPACLWLIHISTSPLPNAISISSYRSSSSTHTYIYIVYMACNYGPVTCVNSTVNQLASQPTHCNALTTFPHSYFAHFLLPWLSGRRRRRRYTFCHVAYTTRFTAPEININGCAQILLASVRVCYPSCRLDYSCHIIFTLEMLHIDL